MHASSQSAPGKTTLDPQREFRFSVPYVWKTTNYAGTSTTAAGLGDVTLPYKQSLWQENDVMARALGLSAEVGLRARQTDTRDERGV